MVRRYNDEQPTREIVAYWSNDPSDGGCLGCSVRGVRVAIIHARGTEYRLCAGCMDEVNGCLGGLDD